MKKFLPLILILLAFTSPVLALDRSDIIIGMEVDGAVRWNEISGPHHDIRAYGVSVTTTLFTLGAGYRPSQTLRFLSSDVAIIIGTAGTITPDAACNGIYLDGITFKAA